MNAATLHRAVVVFAAAMLSACLSLLLFLPAAEAAPTPDQDATGSLEIHKLKQPDQLGAPATGLPQDTAGHTSVAGATFSAQRVPGIDLATTQGQQAAGTLTIAEAAALVVDQPVAATGTTNAQGNTTLAPLEVGLYYVQETDTPAGFVGAAPFLVAVPLTHPVDQDSWLYTVHVYPKNAQVAITLDVVDQHAVTLGDVVHWTSTSTIPQVPELDGYQVQQVINPQLDVTDHLDTVQVTVTGQDVPTLVEGVDYTVVYTPEDRTVTIDFLPPGLQKLQETVAHNPHAQVQIDYDTTVLAEGEHTNQAVLYPSREAIEQASGVQDDAVTKWGPISVLVHEQGNPDNPIIGARFRLYLTAEDAAAGTNHIDVDGVEEWETDAQGRLIVNGLRFSDFVNGLDRDTSDPLYRLYWFAPVHVPEGWRWVDATPLAGVVNSVAEFQTLTFLVERDHSPGPGHDPTDPTTTPGDEDSTGELSTTGAQMTGAILLAGVLLIGGIMLVARRRRRNTQGAEQS